MNGSPSTERRDSRSGQSAESATGDPTGRGDYLTVEEAAQEFRISESALYRALREERLPGVKILGRWRISRAEFIAHAMRKGRARAPAVSPLPRTKTVREASGFRAKALALQRRTTR